VREVSENEVKKLSPWLYYIRFPNGIETSAYENPSKQNKPFQRYRSKLISETVAQILGEKIRDIRVLDIGCHCGIFSLDIAYRGAKQVDGVDVREVNIARANLLKSAFN